MGRKDAKRLKMTALLQSCVDIKPKRSSNEVYINQMMDVTALTEYLAKKKEEGVHYTFFQAFIAAIGKVIYNRPRLNQFIQNRHLYEHNDVTLAFVAKIEKTDASEELMLIADIKPEDTIETLRDQVAAKVNKLRNKSMDKKGANNAVDTLSKLPNFLRVPIFGIMKSLDRRGKVPASLMKDNIYYSSMIISNLGAIHCGAIYHNLADFGSCSSLATMGEVKDVKVLKEDGTEEIRKLCEVGITLDERVGDGFYFAKSCKMIEYILQHPELLEEPASTPVVMA